MTAVREVIPTRDINFPWRQYAFARLLDMREWCADYRRQWYSAMGCAKSRDWQ